MYNSEYILIYKDELLDWPFQEAGAWHLWSFLRLKAATTDSIQRIGSSNTIGTVKFGQFLTSKRFLSEQLHISSRRIDYLLGCFVQAQYIQVQEDSNSILITISGFERFCPPTNYIPSTSWIQCGEDYGTVLTNNGDEVQHSAAEQETNESSVTPPIEPLVLQQVMHQVQQEVQQPVSQTTFPAQSEATKNLPESPIVVEDKKKENNYNNSTTSSTRGEDFFERLRNSPSQLEVVRKQMGLKTVDEVLEKLDFFEIWINGENKQHKSYGDFISHFTSWHRKYSTEKSSKSSAPKHGGGQSARSEKSSGWHENLGIDTKAKCDEDYEEPI